MGQNTAPALTDMAMGYFRSRALCAAARLGVADALAEGEKTIAALAESCGAKPESLYRLLRALASFGVVAETKPASFVLTSGGQPLRKDSPNSEWAAIVFWSDLLADSWAYLTDCVKTGERAMHVRPDGVPSRWSQDPNARAIFGAVMGTAPAEDYMPIARAWDFSTHKVVADLGGGGGALITAVLKAFPSLRGMLVDHQEFIDRAAPRLVNELGGRCTLVGADLCKEVPTGADVYMLKHVLHGYDDAAAVEILRHCRSVIAVPAGRLLVIEFVLPDVVDHADRSLEHRLMSDLNMLAVTGGKERSAIEWKALLNEAGFECLGIHVVEGDLVSIVEAC